MRVTTQDDAYLVRRVRQLTVESDHFAEMFRAARGMHRTDLNALAAIMDASYEGQALSPGELAEALHLSASATTALLDRLEANGHVERVRSSRDRRRLVLTVREQARHVGREFFVPLGTELTRAWAEFTAAERQVIARFLDASIDATRRTRHDLARTGDDDTRV